MESRASAATLSLTRPSCPLRACSSVVAACPFPPQRTSSKVATGRGDAAELLSALG